MSENQAVWKSKNQGLKEATFIQTGRRGRDPEIGREMVAVAEQAVPHSLIKIKRHTLGARDPSPRPDHTAQGSGTRKINPHNMWL